MASLDDYFSSCDDTLPYPDFVWVKRDDEGEQDPDTGIFTPGSTSTVFASAGDVQEDRFSLHRDLEGDKYLRSDATIYFPLRAPLGLVTIGDKVTVEQGKTVRMGRVLEVLLFHHALAVLWY